MENEPNLPPESDDPHFLQARALSLSIGAIRKAQGKKGPNDFPVGSIEWHAAVEDFANDVLNAIMGEQDVIDMPVARNAARK